MTCRCRYAQQNGLWTLEGVTNVPALDKLNIEHNCLRSLKGVPMAQIPSWGYDVAIRNVISMHKNLAVVCNANNCQMLAVATRSRSCYSCMLLSCWCTCRTTSFEPSQLPACRLYQPKALFASQQPALTAGDTVSQPQFQVAICELHSRLHPRLISRKVILISRQAVLLILHAC